MRIKLDTLLSDGFSQAMSKIATHSAFPDLRTSFRVSKSVKVISDKLNKTVEQVNEIKKPFLNSNGEFRRELEDKFKEQFQELIKEEVDINCDKLKFEDIESVNLSPSDLICIYELIEGLPDDI